MSGKKTMFVMMRKAFSYIPVLFLALFLLGCKTEKSGYNPYLKMKERPSKTLSKENAKLEKRTNKASKKKMRESRKKLYGK